MEIEAYIASGIIETVIFGLATPEEVAEMERLAELHPEIAAEIEAIESALEGYATAHAINPPKSLKNKVLAGVTGKTEAPAPVTQPEPTAPTPRPTFANRPERKKFNPAYMGIAASLLLLISLFFNFRYYSQVQSLASENQVLASQQQLLAGDVNKARLEMQAMEEQMEVLQSPDHLKVTLAGRDISPDSKAVVLYNPAEGKVNFAVANLPAPPSGKQYQLWALVDGTPVDLGVFDFAAAKSSLVSMTTVENAGAFAVTLEEAGGVPSPTMEQMYLLGSV